MEYIGHVPLHREPRADSVSVKEVKFFMDDFPNLLPLHPPQRKQKEWIRLSCLYDIHFSTEGFIQPARRVKRVALRFNTARMQDNVGQAQANMF